MGVVNRKMGVTSKISRAIIFVLTYLEISAGALVKNSISHLTSVNDFQVKRKFSHSTRSGKDKWWFIIKGDEEVMRSLENKWEPVKLQAGWQLEPCTKPITLSTTALVLSALYLQGKMCPQNALWQLIPQPIHLTLVNPNDLSHNKECMYLLY